MTIRTKRRGRRSLAAILAAMLMASVLAVVAGAPAQAANTSQEVRIDHDNDASTPSIREFAGGDRYITALNLATNFAKTKGYGNVPVAFVASGETLVDAVAVSGLTGFMDAPVLLTEPDALHPRVANFIEDYGVQTVYVLGGPAAVSESVADAIRALVNTPKVNRDLQGNDRYETAAAIASKLGSGTAWCGGDDGAAMLANGETLTEAMIAGPVANRRQLPVLLTKADELPVATSDFIDSANIKHVVIVGDTDSVTADVESQLKDAGVTTVGRIGGMDAAEVSVNMAETMLTGDCKDELGAVAGAMAALVNGGMDRPDGVAATPVLAGSLEDGDLVPMLIVGDTLPASVRDYLAGTKAVASNGNKVNYRIVAIGGIAAVSEDVMTAALDAAASADDLTVTIGSNQDKNDDGKTNADDLPEAGDDTVRLYFSDNVITDTAKLTAAIRDNLELNDSLAVLAAVDSSATPPQPVGNNTADGCTPNEVTVKLGSALKAGDVLSIVAGAKLGAGMDQRSVGAASYTVPAPAADTSRPTVNVIMIAGRTPNQAEFTVSDNGKPLADATGVDNDLATADITVRDASNATTTGLTVTAVDNTAGTITFGQALEVGDRITISSGVLADAAGNKNLQRSFTAIAPHKSPRITSVTMSSLKHSAQATINVDDALKTSTDADNEIEITAKADGAAAGAAGNDWQMVYDVTSTWDGKKDVDIDIRVSSASKKVSVRFVNGTPTFAELKDELEGNSAFDALFEVKLKPSSTDCDASIAKNKLELATTDRQVGAGTKMASGMTKVAIETRFNGYIATLSDDELLADILNATAVRAQKAAPTTYADVAAALTGVRAALTLTTLADTGDDANKTFSAPGMTVRYEATTSNAGMLPQERDLVKTLAGHAGDTRDLPGDSDPPTIPTVAAVATGYAPDEGHDPADKRDAVDEDKNGASSVWLGRSTSVKAPS